MIPTVSSGLSERVEIAHISQFAFKGFINEALISTLISLIATPCLIACWTSLAYHSENSCFNSLYASPNYCAPYVIRKRPRIFPVILCELQCASLWPLWKEFYSCWLVYIRIYCCVWLLHHEDTQGDAGWGYLPRMKSSRNLRIHCI